MGLWNTRRFLSMNALIMGFAIIIYEGQMAIALMVMGIQIAISSEVLQIGITPSLEHQIPYFNKLRWYILAVSMYIADGHILIDLILNTNRWPFPVLFAHHLLCSFVFSSIAIIWFVVELNRHPTNSQLLRYQYGQFAWSLSNSVLIVAAISPVIRVIFEGMIWAVVPMSTVVANDIFAYGFGKLFGSHPLTQLSPNKTWEGYCGAAVLTVPFGFILTHILLGYDAFLCATDTLQFERVECERHPMFRPREYQFIGLAVDIEPFQIYNLWISIWIAVVCPFGGFLASGYKRSFGLNNYGSLIPGHGGITDRMDAEILMCGFVYFVQREALRSWETASVDEMAIDISAALTKGEIMTLLDGIKAWSA